jgi:uncharacterized protein YgbK (DUF1537 family)
MSARLARSATFAALGGVWPDDPLPANRIAAAQRTLVVLDDDPTGTQTVSDIAVVTTWDEPTLRAELARAAACFYILTNSRSLTADASRALHHELAANLRAAAAATGRPVAVASRSDSTLRGHFPLETDVLAAALGPYDATLLTPYFEAGGRYTLHGTHYVAEDDALVPAAETPFARDAVFGYRNSHLPSWVEEKTIGRVRASAVEIIPLDLIRRGGPAAVAARLRELRDDRVCAVDACAPRDIEVVAAATLMAEDAGARFLYRTAASFVAARIGQAPQDLLATHDFLAQRASGGLILVGSHVPKTSAQLERLLAEKDLAAIEIDVGTLLDPAQRASALAVAQARVNASLAAGRDTVLFTSRTLVTGRDDQANLAIGRSVSAGLIALVQGLTVAPRYLVAKGGITSSDVATHGLGVRRARVLGQALPGVPVWGLGPEARFPGLGYVIFPGNVGGESALADLVRRLRQT